MNDFSVIHISYNTNVMEFEVDHRWNMQFVKQSACQLFNINPDFHFLCANGSTIDDNSMFSQCNLATGTMLEIKKRAMKNVFFVYCYSCENVSPAALIFVCSKCNTAQFHPEKPLETEQLAPLPIDVVGSCIEQGCNSTSGRCFFSCSSGTDHHSVLLSHIKRNFDLCICVACCSGEGDVMVQFCPNKEHCICLDCFKSYCDEYLNEGRFEIVDNIGYTLVCPAGCPASYISDVHHFRILGKAWYSRYKDLSLNRYLVGRNVVECPACGQVWESESNTRAGDWLVCHKPPGCRALFCPTCRWYETISSNSSEQGCRCSTGETVNKTTRNIPGSSIWKKVNMQNLDAENHRTIARICRFCPTCKSPTEKSGGCNHIQCSMCGGHWCWICSDKWNFECQSSHWL